MNQTTRGARRPWRLRTRLALALLAVIIPMAALVIYSHVEDLNDIRDARVESLETVGETVAASMDGFTRDMETFSQAISLTLGQAATTTVLEQATAGPYLQRLQDSRGDLRAVFITDLNGRVLLSNSGDSNGFDLSSRDYIKALQSGSESIWSGALAGSQTSQTTLVHGRQVRSLDGVPRYYLIVAMYAEQLAARLPKDLPADANMSLIDDKGVVIYSSQALTEDRLDVSQLPVFQKARNGAVATIKSEPSPLQPDEERYGAFVPMARNGWVVGYTLPASAIDGPIEGRIRRDAAATVALLIGGFGIIILITTRISGPLATLAGAATAIARGERPPVPVYAPDADVYTLQEAMATMSQAIAERELRLQGQTTVLETLEDVGEILATELDFVRAVRSVAHAALELTQAEAAAFFYFEPEAAGRTLTGFSLSAHTPDEPVPAPVMEDDGLVTSTLEGEFVHIQDAAVAAGPPRNRLVSGEGSASARSLLGIPVVERNGNVQGTLILLHSKPSWFNENHIHLAAGLARRGSVIIETARLYSESQAIQDELRRANVAKDEFIGVMSHELRTPVTTIYGGARLLNARRRHLEDADIDEMVASIEEESERLYRMVENLLALARADLGQVIAGEPISIGPTIEQAIKQFVSRHPSRPVEVRLPPESVQPAQAETTYVHHIIQNLVTNADKYSPPGLPIEVRVSQEDGEIVVRVADHGKGVASEELEHIFASFFRSPSTARQASGKGLGLTVCKRLVETMNGRIWARNNELGGLEVGFTLPVALEEPEAMEPAEAANSTTS